jgi:sulfur carrier protein
MRLTINGQPATCEEDVTLDQVVRVVTNGQRGVAVSVDRVVVPRSAWATTTLVEGAAVEVLVAAAGG